jgi:hypothetical protein
MSDRCHKTVEIKGFPNILLDDGRIRISDLLIRMVQKHTDSKDPDPEHCFFY